MVATRLCYSTRLQNEFMYYSDFSGVKGCRLMQNRFVCRGLCGQMHSMDGSIMSDPWWIFFCKQPVFCRNHFRECFSDEAQTTLFCTINLSPLAPSPQRVLGCPLFLSSRDSVLEMSLARLEVCHLTSVQGSGVRALLMVDGGHLDYSVARETLSLFCSVGVRFVCFVCFESG